MTLTEFLLARIAEDEAVALALIGKPETNDTQSRLSRCADRDYGGTGYLDITPARVLAECEATRRIVIAAQRWRDRAGLFLATGDANSSADCEDRATLLESEALVPLALPYADHPDYLLEWKQ